MNVLRKSQPSVLILGANGRLGCAAAHAFANAGWQVLTQTRRAPSPELPATARSLRIDLSDVDALATAAADASVVVHAINPPYTGWEVEALPALHAGLDVAERLQAHFMLPGNVYNFGDSMPPLLREDTPQRPSTRKGEIRVEMEMQINRRACSGGFLASVLRTGDFFGVGRGGWLDLVIVKSLQTGKLVYPGPMNVLHPWAYLPDFARAFVRVAAIPPKAGFSIWNFSGYAVTGDELLEAIEAAVASDVKPLRRFRHAGMPWRLIQAGGLVVPMWREISAMSYLWRVPHALDGSRLAALADGADPPTPLAAALTDSLQALGFGSSVRSN